MRIKQHHITLGAIYMAAFLFAFHFAMPLYINSTFMARFVGEGGVGILYIIASLLTLSVLRFLPSLLIRFGNFKTILAFLAGDMATLWAIAYFESALLLVPFFVLNQLLVALIPANLDIFLEKHSENKQTGLLRGELLTAVNLAILLAPLAAGFIVKEDNYELLYFASSVMLVPVLCIVAWKLHFFKDPHYKHFPFWKTLRGVMGNKDLAHVFAADFFLRLFYAFMIIYAPLYLHRDVGFSWEHIGILLTVVLLPFILFQIPLGRIADQWLGEKEIMVTGFIITALFTFLLPFVEAKTLFPWMALLFMTRVGAAAIEIMTETHFFKRVNAQDAPIIALFRNNQPLAMILGPAIATLFLFFFDLRFIFFVVALFMCYGIFHALCIRDTK